MSPLTKREISFSVFELTRNSRTQVQSLLVPFVIEEFQIDFPGARVEPEGAKVVNPEGVEYTTLVTLPREDGN